MRLLNFAGGRPFGQLLLLVIKLVPVLLLPYVIASAAVAGAVATAVTSVAAKYRHRAKRLHAA